jgi:hypothetical protein
MTAKKPSPPAVRAARNFISRCRRWRQYLPFSLACGLPQLLRGENQVAYRYEFYSEDKQRMQIQTHSVYFEQKLAEKVTAKGELTYDGVSGATPTGTYKNSNGKVLLKTITPDIRRAANLGAEWRFGDHKLATGFSFSKEHDYLSYGVSVADAFEFNQKNTVLKYGVSHNFDSVLDNYSPRTPHDKSSTDVILGISQLLSPKTILDAKLTFGNDSGYLSDPYRFIEYLPPGFFFGLPANDTRPSHRNKEILLASITHYFESLNASLEGSYRFHHDSYGVFSHTAAVSWHQKLGRYLILEPDFRFYTQSAADFYYAGIVQGNLPPTFYSADYRLSQFYSLNYGIQATLVLNDHVRLNAGYHRYEMIGLDRTDADMYPQANIFTIGLQILW